MFGDELLQTKSEEGLKEVFNLFDTNGNGHITRADLEGVFKEFQEEYDPDYLDKMLVMLDKNNNSYFDFDDFLKVVKNSKII